MLFPSPLIITNDTAAFVRSATKSVIFADHTCE